MPIPVDETADAPRNPWWCKRGNPDANSMIAAVRVQMLLAAGNCASPEDYLIETYGETRERAEEIVRNCRGIGDEREPS